MISDSVFDLIVVGAGPAGLSAAIEASRQGATSVVLEAADTPGGLTRSFQHDGYTFDCSGHLLHLSNPEAIALVERATSSDAWNQLTRSSAIFLRGSLIPYPFQLHLAYAPEHIRRECLDALPKYVPDSPSSDISRDFGRWIAANLGSGIGRHFMVPYNEKLSTVGVNELTTEWLGRFVPQPSLDAIRAGAETQRTVQTGYNRTFLYPTKGGIATLSAGLARLAPTLITKAKVTKIDTRQRVVLTEDGQAFEYTQGVIATVPLPNLAAIVGGSNPAFRDRAHLRATAVTCINVGLKSANPTFSRYQWIYLPERSFSAYRLGFYGRFSDTMAPKGREGVYVEIAHRGEVADSNLVEVALKDLLALHIIETTDSVDTVFPVGIRCAYVIHDRKVAGVRAALHRELARRDVLVAGRYARWEYSAMEDAIIQGIETVRRLLDTAEAGGAGK